MALMQSVSFTTGRNMGHSYENIVFLELKRQNREVSFYFPETRTNEWVRYGLFF